MTTTSNITKIVNALVPYENGLKNAIDNVTIKGKTLEVALREQPTWSAFYLERSIELSTLCKQLEQELKRIRSNLTVRYNENYNPALSERMIEKYIDKESEYCTMYEIYLEVKELHSKYEGLVDVFKSRGFTLRDITLSRVHDIQGDTL